MLHSIKFGSNLIVNIVTKVAISVYIRIPCSDWLVNKQQIPFVVPRQIVDGNASVRKHSKGARLDEQSIHGGAARAAVQPNDQRFVVHFLCSGYIRLKQPEKQPPIMISPGIRNWDLSGPLLCFESFRLQSRY